jgi:DNA-binding NarL/FixJ family response regulator
LRDSSDVAPGYPPPELAGHPLGGHGPASRPAFVVRELLATAARVDEVAPRDAPDPAAVWQAVLAGSWALVAQVERDDRRCLVARRRRLSEPPPALLSEREHRIASFACRGKSNKLIASELGLCSSTVATQLTSATRKLGLASRESLLHAFAVLGPRADAAPAERAAWVTALAYDGDDYAVIWLAMTPRLPPSLTSAEREVATLVVAGLSNAAIAARRCTSVRTVANQLRAIFTKLAIGSRRQLCSRYSVQ